MKVSKIPGLGRFGIYIDGVDFDNMSDDQWKEIGQLHLDSLVTIIRDVKTTPEHYEHRIRQWGIPKHNALLNLVNKYRTPKLDSLLFHDVINGIEVTEQDRTYIKNAVAIIATDIVDNPFTNIIKVSGKKNYDNSPAGMFAEGELLWHSNESGNIAPTPGVSLLGVEGVVGSATGFVTTTDWYEKQSNAMRSELDQMIIQHKFIPGRINPGLNEQQDGVMHRNMCPEPMELPLVAQSPGLIKGIHYSVNTIDSIKGMSKADSTKLLDYISKTLFVDEYIYDHWYQTDNDLCIFDNSITLHRRLGGIADRMCYRIQFGYENLTKHYWCPWFSETHKNVFKTTMDSYNDITITHNYNQ